MKLNKNHLKFLSMLVIVSLFLNFAIPLPSVSAQEEAPPTETAILTLTPTPGAETPISRRTF